MPPPRNVYVLWPTSYVNIAPNTRVPSWRRPVRSLKTVRIEDGRVALLSPRFLFQGLEQPATVAVATDTGMHPEICDLHTAAPDRADDPAHQAAVGVVEPDGNVLARINGCGGNV